MHDSVCTSLEFLCAYQKWAWISPMPSTWSGVFCSDLVENLVEFTHKVTQSADCNIIGDAEFICEIAVDDCSPEKGIMSFDVSKNRGITSMRYSCHDSCQSLDLLVFMNLKSCEGTTTLLAHRAVADVIALPLVSAYWPQLPRCWNYDSHWWAAIFLWLGVFIFRLGKPVRFRSKPEFIWFDIQSVDFSILVFQMVLNRWTPLLVVVNVLYRKIIEMQGMEIIRLLSQVNHIIPFWITRNVIGSVTCDAM